MRKIARDTLSPSSARVLVRRHGALPRGTAAETVEREWGKMRRRSKAMREVLTVLRKMARARERCMYCEDSRGTDIEHFWPKRDYPDKLFDWDNLLLVCSGCNRKKNARFPLDHVGRPLLLDPTADDPWTHLFYEPRTGLVTARRTAGGTDDAKGARTLEVLDVLDHEAIAEGRRRATRNLERAVSAFLTAEAASPDAEGRTRLVRELVSAVRDNDDYGLGQWCFLRDGAAMRPFCELRDRHPGVWRTIGGMVTE